MGRVKIRTGCLGGRWEGLDEGWDMESRLPTRELQRFQESLNLVLVSKSHDA